LKGISKYVVFSILLLLCVIVISYLVFKPPIQRHSGISMHRLFQKMEHRHRMVRSEDRMAIRVPLPSKLSHHMTMPDRPNLYFGYCLDPESPGQTHGPVEIEIFIRDDSGSETVFRKRFPASSKALSRWNEAVIDLKNYSKQTVEIAFKARVVNEPFPRLNETGKGIRFLLWSSPVIYASDMKDRTPNIILIGIDSLRADHLGCYGYLRNTSPAIDGLASGGILFENAFSQSNWTLPSFTSIFTGLYPSHHGAINDRTGIRESLASFPAFLRDQGYFTAGFHEGGYVGPHFGFNAHFDMYRKINGFRSISKVIRWIHEHRGMPYFLFLHTYDVHAPYGSVPAAYTTLYTDADYADPYDLKRKKPHYWKGKYKRKDLFNEKDCTQMSNLYDGEIRFIDDQLAKLFQSLAADEIDHTYIILVSDHGQEFGEHGKFEHRNGHLYKELVHVPLIISGPDLPEGRRVKGLVETIDLLPTMVELLTRKNPEIEKIFDGMSFASFLTSAEGQESGIGKHYVISQFNERNIYSIRSDTWTLIGEHNDSNKLYNRQRDPEEKLPSDRQHIKMEQNLMAAYSSKVGQKIFVSRNDRILSDQTVEELQALGYLQ